MVNEPALLTDLLASLRAMPDVRVVTLFGSRARETFHPADGESDYDLQIVTKHPRRLESREWVERALGAGAVHAWTVKPAFGGAVKISAIVRGAELDLVIVPLRRFRQARLALALGLHRRSPSIRRQLGDLAVVLAPGHRMLIGGEGWRRMLARVVAEVPLPRLDDAAVRNLAEGALIEHRAIHRKLKRGELRAAQRWLHTSLAETNFRLWLERRQRAGEPGFYDGRRLEQVASAEDLAALSVSASLTAEAVAAAADRALETTRELTRALIPAWSMPAAFTGR